MAFTATTKPEDFDKEKKDDKKDDKKDRVKSADDHASDVPVIDQAVYRFNGGGYLDASRTTHICTVEAPESLGDETTKPKQVTSSEFSENDPALTADGARIYFTST